jgi:hypothetical protein
MQFKAEGNGDYSNVLIDGYKTKLPYSKNGGVLQIRDITTYNNKLWW